MRSSTVWYDGTKAGILQETDEGYRFTYTSDYLAEPNARPVSLSLPLQGMPYEAKTLFPFFDGLVPEGWLLDLGTQNWKLDPRDRFGLLLAFCRDPVGAVGVEADV